VAETTGALFHPDLATGPIEEIFRKGRYAAAYSGFEGTSDEGETLGGWLASRRVTDVDVVGIATDYCVYATATDAAKAGYATTVLLNLTAGVDQETTAAAIERLRAAGVTLIGSPQLRAT
jgi:nicotinamidase/pyrazinamidase